jgi:hypothetical protein
VTDLLLGLSFAVASAAVVVGVLVYLTTLRVRVALMVVLDLLLAAALLRLTAADAWGPTAVVAAVVLVRQLAVTGFRSAERARTAPA